MLAICCSIPSYSLRCVDLFNALFGLTQLRRSEPAIELSAFPRELSWGLFDQDIRSPICT
jgi:hypothetical protein